MPWSASWPSCSPTRSTTSTAHWPTSSRAEILPAVEQALQDFLTRFVNDLPFRERMVARLVLTDRTVEKIVEALEHPIGRPARWLPPDTAERLARALAPAIWAWIEQQIPALVERFHIQEMVERKVLAFSQDRVEELIRGVIDRELRLIIRTGYVLGGLIAVVLFGITKSSGSDDPEATVIRRSTFYVSVLLLVSAAQPPLSLTVTLDGSTSRVDHAVRLVLVDDGRVATDLERRLR